MNHLLNQSGLLNGAEHVTLPVKTVFVLHDWLIHCANVDGTTNVSELRVTSWNTSELLPAKGALVVSELGASDIVWMLWIPRWCINIPRCTNCSVATSEAQASWHSAPVARDQAARVTWQGYAALSDFDKPNFQLLHRKCPFHASGMKACTGCKAVMRTAASRGFNLKLLVFKLSCQSKWCQ